MPTSNEHDVRYDYPGHGGHPRLTCCNSACMSATIVKYPSPWTDAFNQMIRDFLQAHPPMNGLIVDADHEGPPLRADQLHV